MNLRKKTANLLRVLLPRRRETATPGGDRQLDRLQSLLSYRFKDEKLLKQSLTHTSAVDSGQANRLDSNERLEFLGDAVLNCLVTDFLYAAYSDKAEGVLSKIKSLLVSRKILGELAVEMDLGDYMILGVSERKTGGRMRLSVLSNAFEAVIGALYLDGGLEVARRFVEGRLLSRIDDFLNDADNVNYKSKILEMSQSDGFGIPRYALVSSTGPDHAKVFHVRIDVAGVTLGEGSGANKKVAQQRAAFHATQNYDREKIRLHNKGEKRDEPLPD